MEKNKLINEITNFCFDYGIFNIWDSQSVIKSKIEHGLGKAPFVESLINTIIVKAKAYSYINVDRLKTILLELEKIRIELEYKDYEKNEKSNGTDDRRSFL